MPTTITLPSHNTMLTNLVLELVKAFDDPEGNSQKVFEVTSQLLHEVLGEKASICFEQYIEFSEGYAFLKDDVSIDDVVDDIVHAVMKPYKKQ